MKEIHIENEHGGLTIKQIKESLAKSIQGRDFKKVLIIPPDITRLQSGAGILTSLYYDLLGGVNGQIDILPALGTHAPMTRGEQITFFGDEIPEERFLVHDWRDGVTKIGEVPGEFVKEVSGGLMDENMDIEVSNYLLDPSYDLILSIGQVVPHEVVGMANYTKNIVVGCGGSRFINQSHMLGALYGMERIMGKDNSPVRKVFDYAEEHFISKLPVEYVLTVTVSEGEETDIIGLYIGKGRNGFTQAVALSQKHNLIYLDSPIKKCVVWLDEREFHSTWLGNKAIYRTRMAIADGGELIILAQGVEMFGEDAENDRLIRKYGYIGREAILNLCKTESDLQNNLSVAAHIIHGSTEERFGVTYATDKLTKDEVEAASFKYMPFDEAVKMYDPKQLKQGYNIMPDGTEIYFIENPAIGLWATKDIGEAITNN
ncbi:MAG: lactate racemase domain-containing protein [Oscillospiraceae bacterium]|nr:lactate racemase domain-containing protein [Oscillospiraceae bacterium]